MASVVVGVDLGGTKIQAAALRDRNVIGTARVRTPSRGARLVIEAVVGTVKDALEEAGASAEDLAAVGIGAPGLVDTEEGTVSRASNVPGFLRKVLLGSVVSKLLGDVPVKVENDVRAAVLGEFRRGAGRPYRDILGVFAGTGVGGGLVLGGRLRHGAGAAGEIGHTLVADGGRPCPCGRDGHLEAYAGRRGMEMEVQRRIAAGEKTVLLQIMEERGRDRLTSGVIARALDRSDNMAHALVADAVWALGVALANAHNLLDLDAILIGGGLPDRLGPPFVERVGAAIGPRLFARAPDILPAALGDLSGAIGAAVIAGG